MRYQAHLYDPEGHVIESMPLFYPVATVYLPVIDQDRAVLVEEPWVVCTPLPVGTFALVGMSGSVLIYQERRRLSWTHLGQWDGSGTSEELPEDVPRYDAEETPVDEWEHGVMTMIQDVQARRARKGRDG